MASFMPDVSDEPMPLCGAAVREDRGLRPCPCGTSACHCVTRILTVSEVSGPLMKSKPDHVAIPAFPCAALSHPAPSRCSDSQVHSARIFAKPWQLVFP